VTERFGIGRVLEISLTFNQLVLSLLGISIRDTEDSQTK
jgi:hypothetical protein